MADHNDLGNIGEKLAVAYLEREAYEILETNWRFSRAEVDIIARKNGVLLFAEVKTRRQEQHGEAELAVDFKKVQLLSTAAAAYMMRIGHDWAIRFDIIAVIYESASSYDIRHFEDAFFPDWE